MSLIVHNLQYMVLAENVPVIIFYSDRFVGLFCPDHDTGLEELMLASAQRLHMQLSSNNLQKVVPSIWVTSWIYLSLDKQGYNSYPFSHITHPKLKKYGIGCHKSVVRIYT